MRSDFTLRSVFICAVVLILAGAFFATVPVKRATLAPGNLCFIEATGNDDFRADFKSEDGGSVSVTYRGGMPLIEGLPTGSHVSLLVSDGLVAITKERSVRLAEKNVLSIDIIASRFAPNNNFLTLTRIPASVSTDIISGLEGPSLAVFKASANIALDTSLATLEKVPGNSIVVADIGLVPASNDIPLFTFVAGWSDASNFKYVRVFPTAVERGEVKNGKRAILSFGNSSVKATASVYARFSPPASEVYFNGKSFRFDTTESASQFGFLGVAPGCEVKTLKSYPAGDVYFADSFMRTKDELWQCLGGRWEIVGMQHSNKSSNPFSLMFTSREHTPFDELFERGKEETTALGINKLPADKDGKAEIIYVVEGSSAEEAGIKVGDKLLSVDGKKIAEWTPMELSKRVQSATDSEIVLQIERAGVEMQLKVAPGAYQRSLSRYTPDRNFIGKGEISPRGIVTTGERFWQGCFYSVSIKPFGKGTVALIFDYTAPDDYGMLRWNSDEPGGGEANSIEIVRVRPNGERVLAIARGGFFSGQCYRMAVDYSGTDIKAFIDDRLVLSAPREDLVCGKIGLLSQGADAVVFDDVYVASTPKQRSQGAFIDTFVSDRLMKYWADKRYDWVEYSGGKFIPVEWDTLAVAGTEGTIYSDIHPLFGDVQMTIRKPWTIRKFGLLGICSSVPSSTTGYVLRFENNGTIALLENGKVIAQTVYKGSRLPATLVLHKTPGKLEVSDGDVTFLSAPAKDEIDGGYAWFSGVRAPFRNGCEAAVESPSAREYTFDSAPWEWEVAAGRWGTMNRWICTPDWSYFGARFEKFAAIWNKEECRGNMALDFYVGFSMPSFVRMPYEKPAGIGITIGGNGRDVISGASFILGRNLNTDSVFKMGDMEVSFPYTFSIQVGSFDITFHQRWVHVVVLLRGEEITLFIDGAKVFQTDLKGKEIPGVGRTAIWTLDNSILIARARIAATSLSPGAPNLKDFAMGVTGPFSNDCDGKAFCKIALGMKADTEQVFEVSPIYGGGSAEFRLAQNKINFNDTPLLSFDFSPWGNPAWDMYFKYAGRLCKIGLFGDEEADEECQFVGKFTLTDLPWSNKRATVNLRAVLQGFFGDAQGDEITDVKFAVMGRKDMIQAGFKSNRSDCGLSIWRVQLAAAAPPAAEPALAAEIVWGAKGPYLAIYGYNGATRFDSLKITVDGSSAVCYAPGILYHASRKILAIPMILGAPLKDADVTLADAQGNQIFSGRAPVKVLRKEPTVVELHQANKWQVFDFETGTTAVKPPDQKGSAGYGTEKSADATHLAEIWTGDPTLGNSLRVMCTNMASVFGASFPFGESVYTRPVLDFRYRLPDKVSLVLRLSTKGFSSMFSLSDSGYIGWGQDDTISRLKQLNDRGGWEHARYNLLDAMAKGSQLGTGFFVDSLDFGDFGTDVGHFDGTMYFLDDVTFQGFVPSA
ncbi:MAG: PDZ domain-containing protein, partial [Candidatus Brocadiia bacterium]